MCNAIGMMTTFGYCSEADETEYQKPICASDWQPAKGSLSLSVACGLLSLSVACGSLRWVGAIMKSTILHLGARCTGNPCQHRERVISAAAHAHEQTTLCQQLLKIAWLALVLPISIHMYIHSSPHQRTERKDLPEIIHK